MPRFKIQVLRIAFGTREIEVEAENSKKAEEKAINVAGDYEFNEHDAVYQAEGVTKVR